MIHPEDIRDMRKSGLLHAYIADLCGRMNKADIRKIILVGYINRNAGSGIGTIMAETFDDFDYDIDANDVANDPNLAVKLSNNEERLVRWITKEKPALDSMVDLLEKENLAAYQF